MEVKESARRFEQAVSTLPESIGNILKGIPLAVKARTFEVRLRVGRPIALSSGARCWFVDSKSELHNIPKHCFSITQEDLAQAVVQMCSYSVHSHQQELAKGYLSLRGGHRAGICGTAVMKGDTVSTVRDITSINLRIAREIHGAATPLIERIFKGGVHSALITGIPSSGKTTILRDLARQLSNGEAGSPLKVAVVDERGELGAVFEGIPQNDLGVCCDILTGYPKGEGILTAVRTMSPQVVLCDEIGAKAEVDSILDGLNCGVKVIATAHAATMSELLHRKQIRRLLENQAFDKVVRLGDAKTPGIIEEIVEAGELIHGANWNAAGRALLYHDGTLHGVGAVPQGGES